MGISLDNQTQTFQYSSSLPAANEKLFDVGSTDALTIRKLHITDLKISNTNAASKTVKFHVASVSAAGQALEFDVPGTTCVNYSWQVPHQFNWVSSTLEHRPFVGSASATGIKYSITGYVETS